MGNTAFTWLQLDIYQSLFSLVALQIDHGNILIYLAATWYHSLFLPMLFDWSYFPWQHRFLQLLGCFCFRIRYIQQRGAFDLNHTCGIYVIIRYLFVFYLLDLKTIYQNNKATVYCKYRIDFDGHSSQPKYLTIYIIQNLQKG